MTQGARFSRRASVDLDEAVSWLLDHGGSARLATGLLRDVQAAGALLAQRPGVGRFRPNLLPEPYRFWSLPRHRLLLVYNPTTDPVRVARILSTSRDLETLLADPAEFPDPD